MPTGFTQRVLHLGPDVLVMLFILFKTILPDFELKAYTFHRFIGSYVSSSFHFGNQQTDGQLPK
jgi:hypothetical protein